MTVLIDPENISPADQKKLFRFFSEPTQSDNSVWSSKKIYHFADGTPFHFPYKVLKRERKAGKEDFRYEFISDELIGEGTWGKVYKIKGTLGFPNNNFQYNPAGYTNKHGETRSRVVKIQFHDDNHPTWVVENEYLIANATAQFSIKRPVIIPLANKITDKANSYLVMEEVPGLSDWLDDDLSVYQRVEITRQILAIAQMLKENKVIHRDFKLENFKVDFNYPIRVTLLDYGLSTDAEEPNQVIGGSKLYISPDMFNGSQHTYGLDIFSIGRCLEPLWGMPEDIWQEDWGNGMYPADLNFLFQNIDGLSSEQKETIRCTIKGMLEPTLERRISIETAIEAFDSLGDFIYEEALYKLECLNHPLGKSLLQVLDRLEKGANSKNPYWMNASNKFVEIISAVLDTDDLVGAMSDPNSLLYKAVNMQRITPGSFFGKPCHTKSLKIIEEPRAFSCIFG